MKNNQKFYCNLSRTYIVNTHTIRLEANFTQQLFLLGFYVLILKIFKTPPLCTVIQMCFLYPFMETSQQQQNNVL